MSRKVLEGLVAATALTTCAVGAAFFGHTEAAGIPLAVGTGVISGVIANMTDRSFFSGAPSVLERLTGHGPDFPPNHDVAHATRLSQIRAVEAIARKIAAELKEKTRTEDIEGDRSKQEALHELDEFVSAIVAWKRHAESELQAHFLEVLDSAAVAAAAADVRALLNNPVPTGQGASARFGQLWKLSGAALLVEIVEFVDLGRRKRSNAIPDLFRAVLKGEDVIGRVSFADATQAFFVEMLKTDQRLFSVVTVDLLQRAASTNEESLRLIQEFQPKLLWIGTALSELDARLALFATAQNEKLDRLQDQVARLIAMFASETSAVAAFERWTAAEYVSAQDAGADYGLTAAQVRDLIATNGAFFVGREHDLAALDAMVTESDRALITVAAPAGFGKSALLVEWMRRRREAGDFVVRHFSARREPQTVGIRNSLEHILRQILAYRKETAANIPDSESKLSDAIYERLKQPAADGEKLVLIIDGLDEADGSFPAFVRSDLGKGTYVVLGVRAEPRDEPEVLRRWLMAGLGDLERIRLDLDALLTTDVVQWLRMRTLKVRAVKDERITAGLERASERVPLFLKYIVDDLVEKLEAADDRDILLCFEKLPESFTEYVRQELDALDQINRGEDSYGIRALFAVLTQTLEPISAAELRSVNDELRRPNLRALDHRVGRWFSISGIGAGRTFMFAHQKLAAVFGGLLDEANEARDWLSDHCEQRWGESGAFYALSRVPDHLIDAAMRKNWSHDSIKRAAKPLTTLEFHQKRLLLASSDELMARAVVQLRLLADKGSGIQ